MTNSFYHCRLTIFALPSLSHPLQDYPKVASEIWVADTPNLTPYKPRCESVSSGFLSLSQQTQPDSISETDSVKTPKGGFDLAGHLEQAMSGVSVNGVGAEGGDRAGVAFNRELSSTSDTTSQFERECRTPRDHSQVMKNSVLALFEVITYFGIFSITFSSYLTD
jgi:hypothetical protein